MAESLNQAENYDDSMIKCEKIQKLIPLVYKSIQEMQAVDKEFAVDFHLQLASQILSSLNTLELPKSSQEKQRYVSEYREQLTEGLRNLAGFFDSIVDVARLDEEQRSRMSSLSANMVIQQSAIVRIASS